MSETLLVDQARRRIAAGIRQTELAERVLYVFLSLPIEVATELLEDPAFHLAEEDYHPAVGSRVWLAAPDPTGSGSRSVILRRRLAECSLGFARYIIAHELAHAVLWNGGWGEITDREQAADALAAQWGFSRPS